jgi:probable HAF family extracellular repeat protein
MTDLGTVSGDDCGIAFGINSIGQVVGSSGDCQGNGLHAFLWNGDIVDLNSLVSPSSALQLKSATNINDRAEIAGTGVTPNGDLHAFLLIPCDDEHPDVEGCEGDAPARNQLSPGRVNHSSVNEGWLNSPRNRTLSRSIRRESQLRGDATDVITLR